MLTEIIAKKAKKQQQALATTFKLLRIEVVIYSISSFLSYPPDLFSP